jgi:hypothetical protein
MGSLLEILSRLQQRPAFVTELLRDALHVSVPYNTEAHLESSLRRHLSQTVAAPDLLITLNDHVSSSGLSTPVFAVVVEALTECESEKRFTWPFYAAALRVKLRCPVCVLVLTPDPIVERWARQPILTGQPDSNFRPLVLGPPFVKSEDLDTEPNGVREMALLSLLSRGGRGVA